MLTQIRAAMALCVSLLLFQAPFALAQQLTKPVSVQNPPEYILSLAFSPDSKFLATGTTGISPDEANIEMEGTDSAFRSAKGKIIVWDVEKEKWLSPLEAHTRAVSTVIFSPDGLTLAAGSFDGKVTIWDVKTWDLKDTLSLDAPISALAYSKDGTILAASTTGASLTAPTEFVDETGHLYKSTNYADKSLDLSGVWQHQNSNNAKFYSILNTSPSSVRIWKTDTNEVLQTFTASLAAIEFLQFLPDNKTLMTATSGIKGLKGVKGNMKPDYTNRIQLWEVETGQEKQSLDLTSLRSFAVTADGKTAAFGTVEEKVGSVVVLNTSDLAVKRKFEYSLYNSNLYPNGLAFSSNNAYLAVSAEGMIALYGSKSDEPVSVLSFPTAYLGGRPIRMAFSPDKKLFVSASFPTGQLSFYD